MTSPLKQVRLWIALVVVLAVIGGSANEFHAWRTVTRDCAAAALDESLSHRCFELPGDGPDGIDWTAPDRRNRLWMVVGAPDWMLATRTTPAEWSRNGANLLLTRTARTDDEERIVRGALDGSYRLDRAAAHLAAVWSLDDARPEIGLARLVDGSDEERLLACATWAAWSETHGEERLRSCRAPLRQVSRELAAGVPGGLPLAELEASLRDGLARGRFPEPRRPDAGKGHATDASL